MSNERTFKEAYAENLQELEKRTIESAKQEKGMERGVAFRAYMGTKGSAAQTPESKGAYESTMRGVKKAGGNWSEYLGKNQTNKELEKEFNYGPGRVDELCDIHSSILQNEATHGHQWEEKIPLVGSVSETYNSAGKRLNSIGYPVKADLVGRYTKEAVLETMQHAFDEIKHYPGLNNHYVEQHKYGRLADFYRETNKELGLRAPEEVPYEPTAKRSLPPEPVSQSNQKERSSVYTEHYSNAGLENLTAKQKTVLEDARSVYLSLQFNPLDRGYIDSEHRQLWNPAKALLLEDVPVTALNTKDEHLTEAQLREKCARLLIENKVMMATLEKEGSKLEEKHGVDRGPMFMVSGWNTNVTIEDFKKFGINADTNGDGLIGKYTSRDDSISQQNNQEFETAVNKAVKHLIEKPADKNGRSGNGR